MVLDAILGINLFLFVSKYLVCSFVDLFVSCVHCMVVSIHKSKTKKVIKSKLRLKAS